MSSPQRRLGSAGPEVHPIGLGCMGMSDFYGPAGARADDAAGIAVIHRGHLSEAEPSETLDRGSLGLRMAGHNAEDAA